MKDWLEEASVLVGCFINCAFIVPQLLHWWDLYH